MTASPVDSCPLDEQFFEFMDTTGKAFLAAMKTGKSDSEMLASVNAHSKRVLLEIVA